MQKLEKIMKGESNKTTAIKNLSQILNKEELQKLLQKIHEADAKTPVQGLLIVSIGSDYNILVWNEIDILMFKGGACLDGKKSNVIAVLRNLLNNNEQGQWTNRIVRERTDFIEKVSYQNRDVQPVSERSEKVS